MNTFKDLYSKLKNKVFGKAADDITNNLLPRLRRLNEGPADVKYLRSLFPNSVLTQPITHARAETIRLIYRNLRPEQRVIVRSRGWLKGVV